MDKRKLLEQLIELVTEDLEKARQAAVASSEGATHEENKAEGSKDMRSTEASYLARGQAIRVEELEDTLNRLRFMPVKSFNHETAISAGALICLENENGHKRWYWLVTGAAGYELHQGNTVVTTITPRSPLGKELVEKFQGDEVDLIAGNNTESMEIVDIK